MDENDSLPRTETSFFILLSLSATPKHGYGIIKEVEALSAGRVVLASGTLYSALRRMLEDGWIERIEEEASTVEKRERKLYKLSPFGGRLLKQEANRLQMLVRLTTSLYAGQ